MAKLVSYPILRVGFLLLKKLQYFSVLLFVFALVFIFPSVSRVQGAKSEAVSRISQAEDYLEAAYFSLLEAERAGGDVSGLVVFLNTALEYYSEAERALEYGEYETVVQLAEKVVEASNVVLEANIGVMVVSKDVKETELRNQFLLSFGSVCFIILLGFVGWKWFKDYYTRRVMGLRPEVVADET